MSTAVMKLDPFRELTSMQNRINELFRGAFPTFGEQALTTGSWTPAVDIYESPEAVELLVDLPGVDKKDIQVHMESNVLTISGERRLTHDDNRDGYHRVECNYGAFMRSFTIPANVDTNKINAEYRDGVLRLTLPKKPEAQPKQIKIS
ncbi:MAG TPA: Hsp20/alpha crystallin family protein [Blastocatellia bacterium]|nr:Hsp20/alpha crystallin family protein [Blastocatellia bacterium]